jgi:hypothetical protein
VERTSQLQHTIGNVRGQHVVIGRLFSKRKMMSVDMKNRQIPAELYIS